MSKEDIPYKWWAKNHKDGCITVYDNDIARASSIMEAVFVRRFIYLWEKCKHKGEMFIIPDDFCNPVGMTKYAFRKIVKRWEEKGIIKTKSKGLPLKKWYRLNENKLAKHLTTLKLIGGAHLVGSNNLGLLDSEDKVHGTKKIYNKRKVSKHSQSHSAEGDCFEEFSNGDPNPKGFKNAKRLYKVLAKKRKIMRTPNIKSWCRSFAKLERDVPKKKIREVISWYGKNVGEEFIPQAYSAKAFCDKFENIVAAMIRNGGDQESMTKAQIRKLSRETNEWLYNMA